MIIDQLNTELTGGAAVAAQRLHRALLSMGVGSRFWCARLPAGFEDAGFSVLSFREPTETLNQRLSMYLTYARRKLQWRLDKWRYLKGRSSQFERFSVPWLLRHTPFNAQVLSGDVLHLHWVTKFLDVPSFFASLPNNHPIVWTLHDMSPFTGGCHHADGCLAFTQECGCCPQLVRPYRNDLSNRAFTVKLSALRGKNLHVVTPSRWLERLARQSRIFSQARSVQTIHNGLDVRRFKPLDKDSAKRRLGLPDNKKVVAFGAGWLPNRRKGFVEYVASVSKVAAHVPLVGLVFGDGAFPSAVQPSFPIQRVGFLSEPEELSRVYSAADVFVLPSLGENIAQTGVESLACGTPVVAFDVGGLSEYVRPGETGLLAPLGDTDELARHIQWLLEHDQQRHHMSIAGRRLVEREFDHVQQARQYIALYESLCAACIRRETADHLTAKPHAYR